jgi:hypothetical protein
MTVTVEIEGLSQVSAFLKRYGQEAEREIGKDVVKTALEINTGVKKRIQRGPKSGRVYTRGSGQNLSREHQASAPGEAPAADSGVLASSIYFEQSGKLSATIGSRLAYAYYLEFGTSRIDPRPAWVPETELGQVALNKRVEATLRKAAQ